MKTVHFRVFVAWFQLWQVVFIAGMRGQDESVLQGDKTQLVCLLIQT